MNTKRQQLILELLTTQDVRTQKQLLDLLEAHGMKCTQSTVSRDIRALGLVKQIGADGSASYAVDPGTGSDSKGVEQMQYIAQMSAPSIEAVGNLIVVKTIHSMAQAVCAYIDKLNPDGFVGSIAGVDTILLILRTDEAAKTFCRTLSDYLCSGELFLEHENGGENA